ncbi:MAG: hypothetical protein RL088_3723 [Verrucomicrobiota bacterium]|jgi:prepilin-type N-terminal cleavage/methylation domain-containing protein
MKIKKHSGFTLIELLVVISIIAILAGFALPVFTRAQKSGRLSNSLNNANQISKALKMYAMDTGGIYPTYKDPEDATQLVATSNEALELLMPKYSKSKLIFVEKNSAWCKGQTQGSDGANQYKLNPKDCDWTYVRGLSETNDPRLPLLATAFSEGGKVYVKDTTKKGGVWGGEDAILVSVDHSCKQVNVGSGMKETGSGTMITRPDDRSKNMFEKADDWLAGDQVEVLMPK